MWQHHTELHLLHLAGTDRRHLDGLQLRPTPRQHLTNGGHPPRPVIHPERHVRHASAVDRGHLHPLEHRQRQQHHDRRHPGHPHRLPSDAHTQPDRPYRPQARRCRETAHDVAVTDNRASPQEAHPRRHLRGHPSRVGSGAGEAQRRKRVHRCAEAHENVRPQARRAVARLSLPPDYPAADHGRHQLQQQKQRFHARLNPAGWWTTAPSPPSPPPLPAPSDSPHRAAGPRPYPPPPAGRQRPAPESRSGRHP